MLAVSSQEYFKLRLKSESPANTTLTHSSPPLLHFTFLTSDPKTRTSVRPAAVWQEIVSYIKGSAEAMETTKVRKACLMH